MDGDTQIPKSKCPRAAYGAIILLLAAYGAWTTTEIVGLQGRLGRLEASHDALGRYTYDLGAAIAPVSDQRKTYIPFDANSILLQMRRDPLLGPTIDQPRARQLLIRTHHSTHNSLPREPIR